MCRVCGQLSDSISFVVHRMAEYYRELGHVRKSICINNDMFDTDDVNTHRALSLVNQETTHELTSKVQEIEDNYIFGSYMWPSVGEAHEKK